jgi:RNA polymerase subunit RPABC4/transcription elongation factor Spt4
MDELMNDSTYKCRRCKEIIMAYSTSGETNFCPVCGSRDLEGYYGEEEE